MSYNPSSHSNPYRPFTRTLERNPTLIIKAHRASEDRTLKANEASARLRGATRPAETRRLRTYHKGVLRRPMKGFLKGFLERVANYEG